MASYYRQATVYTSFATTALGLLAMGVIAVMDFMEKRKRKRSVSSGAVIPPGIGKIQAEDSINGTSILSVTSPLIYIVDTLKTLYIIFYPYRSITSHPGHSQLSVLYTNLESLGTRLIIVHTANHQSKA